MHIRIKQEDLPFPVTAVMIKGTVSVWKLTMELVTLPVPEIFPSSTGRHATPVVSNSHPFVAVVLNVMMIFIVVVVVVMTSVFLTVVLLTVGILTFVLLLQMLLDAVC